MFQVAKKDGQPPSVRALKDAVKNYNVQPSKKGRRVGWRKTTPEEDAATDASTAAQPSPPVPPAPPAPPALQAHGGAWSCAAADGL